MKRETSSVVSSAKSDGASDARSSRNVTVRAGQHRQAVAPVRADTVRSADHGAAESASVVTSSSDW